MRPGLGSRGSVRLVRLLFVVGVLGICAGIWYLVSGGSAREFEFRFNPPDGITYVAKDKTTWQWDNDPGGKTAYASESKDKVTVKRTATGYRMTGEPISGKYTRDGKIDPVYSAVYIRTVTFECDRQGQPYAVRGFENVADEVMQRLGNKKLDKGTIALLLRVEQDVMQWARREWKNGDGKLVGRKARLGDVWDTTQEIAVWHNAVVNTRARIRFAQVVERDGKECLRLEITYKTNKTDLKRQLEKLLNGQPSAPSPTPYEVVDAEITGSEEVIIAPDTLLSYSGKMDRTVKLTAKSYGRDLKYTMWTKQESTRDYSK